MRTVVVPSGVWSFSRGSTAVVVGAWGFSRGSPSAYGGGGTWGFSRGSPSEYGGGDASREVVLLRTVAVVSGASREVVRLVPGAFREVVLLRTVVVVHEASRSPSGADTTRPGRVVGQSSGMAESFYLACPGPLSPKFVPLRQVSSDVICLVLASLVAPKLVYESSNW